MNINSQRQHTTFSNSKESLAILEISHRSKKINEINLTDSRLIIGKDKSANIKLQGLSISKKHAILTFSSDHWSIADNSSMIGTFVNDQRILEYDQLQDEDIIRIHDYTLKIRRLDRSSAKATVDNIPTLQPSTTAIALDQSRHLKATENTKPASMLTERQHANYNQWREKLHHEVIATFDLRRQNVSRFAQHELQTATREIAQNILTSWQDQLPSTLNARTLLQAVIDDIVGLGPLELLLKDPGVSEIMVNAADEIFIERNGQIEKSTLTFPNDNAVLAVIDRIITPLGRRIDQSSPMVDARLQDGSRVNAIIPPLAIKGPCITIRKFPTKRLNIQDLVHFGSLDNNMADFFQIAVSQGKNILVSGGTGTGKTTLLNALSNQIPHNERVITIEDAAELQLNQPDLVALESKPSNMEGQGAIHIRDLVKNALRMRPNRIVVGECRGAEALDMLQAMNTGHDGSLTTLHANTPRDAISRLEVMVLMAGMDIPIQAIREQISSAIHIIVQQTRFPCGARKITHITEVVGMEAGTIQLQDIFKYQRQGMHPNGKIQGKFKATGFIPTFYQLLAEYGHQLDTSLFFDSTPH